MIPTSQKSCLCQVATINKNSKECLFILECVSRVKSLLTLIMFLLLYVRSGSKGIIKAEANQLARDRWLRIILPNSK